MNIAQWLKDALPEILKYIVPGYLCVFTYRTVSPTKSKFESDLSLVISVIILSYVIQAIAELFGSVPTLGILGIALAMGFFGKLIRNSELVKNILNNYFSITSQEDVWDDVFDREVGQHARVYLEKENTSYYGELRAMYSSNNGQWLVLQNYAPVEDSKKNNEKRVVVINLKDVNCTEVYYPAESKKWD